MVARYKSETLGAGGGDYFAGRNSKLSFIPSGCTLLDCVLGGGWPLGRVSNIVGDRAVGKTLLAIEACHNFATLYPKGQIWYRESEAAFDEDYAESLGLPLKRVDFGKEGLGTQWNAIEDVYEDMDRVLLKAAERKTPGLYIIDSLDALSSRAELERSIDKGSYNMEKQKHLGELFRRLTRRFKACNVHLSFISQVRQNIGVSFGDKYTRSAGKSLDFYESQELWLSNLGQVKKKIKGVERAVGIRVRAKCKKNKIGLPFRECEFTLRFGFGVEDLEANIDWLADHGRLDAIGLKESQVKKWLKDMDQMANEDRWGYDETLTRISNAVKHVWREIDKDFLPKRRKYA